MILSLTVKATPEQGEPADVFLAAYKQFRAQMEASADPRIQLRWLLEFPVAGQIAEQSITERK